MSTILKSLRKLEEEKKAHDKKLNLKQMMIREEGRPPVRENPSGRPRHWWTGLGLLLAGFGVAGFMAFLLWPVKNSTDKAEAPITNSQQNPNQSGDLSKPLGGVPLSSIPDFTERFPVEDEDVIEEFFVEEEPAPVLEEPIATEKPPEPIALELPVPALEPATTPPLEANDQIVEALGQVPTQTRTTLEPTPNIPEIIPLESGESIEGLKLKGIIFYGEGNPENYLLFSYPGMSIHRLKVGETIAEAKLIEIHPGLAVFEFEGRQIEQKVGS